MRTLSRMLLIAVLLAFQVAGGALAFAAMAGKPCHAAVQAPVEATVHAGMPCEKAAHHVPADPSPAEGPCGIPDCCSGHCPTAVVATIAEARAPAAPAFDGFRFTPPGPDAARGLPPELIPPPPDFPV